MYREIILFILVLSELHQANACEGNTTGHVENSNNKKHDDNLSGFGMIATDKKYRFECCGTIQQWRVKAGAAGEVALQVWRPTNKNREYRLMGQNIVKIDKAGYQTVDVPFDERISVNPGDHIGWHATSTGVVVYEDGGSNGNLVMLNMPYATYMAVLDWSSAILVYKRSYIFDALGTKNNPPSIRNLPMAFGIKNDHPLGNIFFIEASDNDKLDISSLEFSLEEKSPYFTMRKGMVILIKRPPAQLFQLTVRVTDHCGGYVTGRLNISVIDAGPTTESPFRKLTCLYGFAWDWLVTILVVTAFILTAASLLIISNRKGWLLKTTKTHPLPSMKTKSVTGSYYNSKREPYDSRVYNRPSETPVIKDI